MEGSEKTTNSTFSICMDHPRAAGITHPSRLILLVRSSQRFLVSTKIMVLFSFSAIISSISWISLQMGKHNPDTSAAPSYISTVRTAEHDIFRAIILLPSVLLVLFSLHTDVDNLQDVVVGAELQSPNINLDVVLQEVLSQLPYFLGPGCTPH